MVPCIDNVLKSLRRLDESICEGAGLPGERILVVDDDPETRFLLRLIVESEGYVVSDAQNGIAALIRIKESLPDLVITDMIMPLMGGGELIERLRSDPRTANLQIMAVSGVPGAKESAVGADAVLGKPFDRTRLLAVVSGLLASEQSLD